MLFRPQSHFSCFSTFFICFFPLSSILFLSLSLSLNVSFFYFLRALFYFSVLILSFLFFCFYLFSLQIYPSPYIFFKKKTTFLFFLSILCFVVCKDAASIRKEKWSFRPWAVLWVGDVHYLSSHLWVVEVIAAPWNLTQTSLFPAPQDPVCRVTLCLQPLLAFPARPMQSNEPPGVVGEFISCPTGLTIYS